MDVFLMAAPLALMGLICGLYISGPIHDFCISDLTASQYMAMHQMRDRAFRLTMPFIGLTTIALVIATTIFAVEPGLPQWLALAALILILADMIITMRRQVPINREIQRWTATTIPSDWIHTRDLWAANHALRVGLSILAYGCLLAAVLLTLTA